MFEQFELATEARLWIHLVWASLLVLGICAWGIASRTRRLETFGYDRARSAGWIARLRRRRWRRAFLLAISLLFLASAAVQPRANPERTTIKTSARDIVLILDVSRSMLAEDLKPNRLERAKLELSRLADRLEGDRLGLIVFAGDAVIKCPLTSNYSYFKSVLRQVDEKSAPQGGTRIGDAIRKALRDLLGVDRGERIPAEGEESEPGEAILEEELRGEKEVHADIILITDGEDHESYPIHAARRAAQFNVGIYAVGLGSEEGTPIPVTDKSGRQGFLQYEGETVLSRLDSRTLQDMVNAAPRGRYLPVGTFNFDLVDFFEKTIDLESGREVFDEQVVWTEIFQPFLIAGLVLYLIYLLFPERPRHGELTTLEASS